jgi:hypothetical protein
LAAVELRDEDAKAINFGVERPETMWGFGERPPFVALFSIDLLWTATDRIIQKGTVLFQPPMSASRRDPARLYERNNWTCFNKIKDH